MTKQQFFIYFLVGLMVFTAIGTGILLLANPEDSDTVTSLNTPNDNDSSLTVNDGSTAEDPIPLEDRFLPEGEVVTLETTDLVVGNGDEAVAASTITVHYTGWLASDGTIFDSSVTRGAPATFPLSGVIEGWQEGIPGMQVGGKRLLVIPAEQAYGAVERPGIPANSALVFEVELIEVVQ